MPYDRRNIVALTKGGLLASFAVLAEVMVNFVAFAGYRSSALGFGWRPWRRTDRSRRSAFLMRDLSLA